MSMSFEDLDLNLSSGSFCPITSDKFIYVSSPPYSHLCTRDSDTSTMGSLYLHSPTSHSISLLKGTSNSFSPGVLQTHFWLPKDPSLTQILFK